MFNNSACDKDRMAVGVGNSRIYCNTAYDRSQGRRPSTFKCIGSISKDCGVPRGGGQRGRFAPGGTLRGAARRRKTKKEKRKKGKRKEREKGKKKEKENMGEACNNSKTKMEHISCGASMHCT